MSLSLRKVITSWTTSCYWVGLFDSIFIKFLSGEVSQVLAWLWGPTFGVCWEVSNALCLTLSLPESMMETCKLVVNFESVHEIPWCDHSIEISFTVLSHGIICLATARSERVNILAWKIWQLIHSVNQSLCVVWTACKVRNTYIKPFWINNYRLHVN